MFVGVELIILADNEREFKVVRLNAMLVQLIEPADNA